MNSFDIKWRANFTLCEFNRNGTNAFTQQVELFGSRKLDQHPRRIYLTQETVLEVNRME